MNVKSIAQRVRAMLGVEPVSTLHIAERCGISTSNALYYLNHLVETGEALQGVYIVHHEGTNASSRRYTFRLAEQPVPVPEAPTPATPPAYRNLRLTETLTGYESSLFRFADICMMVRR